MHETPCKVGQAFQAVVLVFHSPIRYRFFEQSRFSQPLSLASNAFSAVHGIIGHSGSCDIPLSYCTQLLSDNFRLHMQKQIERHIVSEMTHRCYIELTQSLYTSVTGLLL